MNDNRKLCLSLVSILGIITTAMTFLFPQSSPYWIASQAFLLMGTVIYLGMALFVTDARNFRLFAFPGAIMILGELFYIFSQFHFEIGEKGMLLQCFVAEGQPIALLSVIAGVLQFVVLAWVLIDISTDFSFCDITCLGLAVCCGFSLVVDSLVFFFGIYSDIELIQMLSVTCLSDVLAFATVVVFYFTYTKERRMVKRYYKSLAMEQRKAKQQVADEVK